MTNQLQGEILFGGWTGTNPEDWAYTPWMPVRGDYATFGVEVLVSSGVTLTWEAQTRTLEDATVTSLLTATTAATAMNTTVTQQLVRYRFKTGTGNTSNFVIFRALQPSWQTDR